MARACLPAMNHINPDLTFTTEVAEDYENKKLPTLDFNLWMKEDMTLTHNYYEMPMKTQMMLDRGSAMSKRQKYCIQANELTRRLMNIDEEEEGSEEEVVVETIEQFTR